MKMNEPGFVFDRHAELIFNMLARESTSLQEDMPLYSDSWLTSLCSLIHVLLNNGDYTNFNVSGLTRQGIKSMTLFTCYTTKVFKNIKHNDWNSFVFGLLCSVVKNFLKASIWKSF